MAEDGWLEIHLNLRLADSYGGDGNDWYVDCTDIVTLYLKNRIVMKDFLLTGRPPGPWGHAAAILLLRLFVGAMMLTHGMTKLMNFAALSGSFPDPIGIGSAPSLTLALLAEAGCSILIMAGFLTRLATLPLIVNMLVAAFVAHGGDPFQVKELAIMYLGIYVVLLLTGAGRFSVDYLLFGKKRQPSN